MTIDELAQEIRRVDGSHSLGAGALAEALLPFILSRLDKAEAEAKAAREWIVSLLAGEGPAMVPVRWLEKAEMENRFPPPSES